MRPLSLSLTDFQVHRQSDIDFSDFQSVVILGETNGDPEFSSGAGKSTIFAGIIFALFGEVPTSTIQKVIRIGATKTSVTFIFMVHKKIYKIERSRTKNTGEIKFFLQNEGVWEDLTQMRKGDAQALINETLGYPYHTFNQASYLSQKSLDSLVKSSRTGKEKLEILRQVFNLIIYSKLEKLAKDKVSEINKEVSALQQTITSLGNPEADLVSISASLIKNKELLESSQTKKTSNLLELETTQSHLAILEKGATEHNDLLVRKSFLNGKLEDLNSQLSKSKVNLAKSDPQPLQIELDSKTDLLIRKRDLIIPIINIELLTTQAIEDTSFSARRAELAKELKVLENTKVPENPNCEECFQEISSDYRDEFQAKIRTQINVIQATFLEAQAAELTETNRVKQARLTLAEETKKLQTNRALEAEIPHLEERIEQLRVQIAEKNKDKAQITSHVEDLESQLETIKQQAADLQKLLEEPEKQLSLVQESQAKIKNLKIAIALLDSEILKLTLESGSLSEKHRQKTQDLVKLKATKASLTKVQANLKLKSELVAACASTGIPNMVVYSMLDDFQVILNKTLAKIRPNFEAIFQISKTKKGIDEDNFDIIFRLNGVELDLSQISGGQELMVRLALKIALTELLKSRLELDIQVLFLDEVDREMDMAASKQLFKLIRELEKDYLVMVITHKDYLKSNFKHFILVQNHGIQDGATVKVVSA